MGKILKFTGQFHGPENIPPTPESEETVSEVEQSPAHNDRLDRIETFVETVSAMRKSNPHIKWLGQTAKDYDQLVRGYSWGEIENWAASATKEEINQRPLFFSSLQEELLTRIRAEKK